VLFRSLLKGVDLAQISAALKRCGISAPATALLLTPSTLSFVPGRAATKGFSISGGTPPYVVEALDALPDGLSTLFRGGLADSAQVKVSASTELADEYRILVSDSGPAKRTQQLVIKADPVKATRTAPAAQAQAAGAGPASDTSTIATAWKALIAAMTQPSFKRQIGSVTFSVTSAQLVADGLRVVLKCSKADAGLDAVAVREQLTVADKKATLSLREAKALDDTFSQIDLKPSAPCVKG
jgi:hypothetical protein